MDIGAYLSVSLILNLVVFAILLSIGDSKSGFAKINRWTQPKSNDSMKLVCYLSLSPGDFNTSLTQYLDPTLCTHILYIGSGIGANCEVNNPPSSEVVTYFQSLKKANPSLKILSTNGGNFDYVLGSETNRTRFVGSISPYLQKYGFDGFDFDWEYPGNPGSKPLGQIHNFSLLLQELHGSFQQVARMREGDSFLITMAVTGWGILMDVLYQYDYIEKYVDYVSIMGYDYNGFSIATPFTGYNSPLFGIPNDIFFLRDRYLAWSAREWAKKISKDKILVGAPSYTRAYTLDDPTKHANRDAARGNGLCNGAELVCACNALKKLNGTRVFDNTTKVPYIYYGDQWITYDDMESITIKAKWVKDNSFAGMMLFRLNTDDYGAFCDGKTRFPITSTIKQVLFNEKADTYLLQ